MLVDISRPSTCLILSVHRVHTGDSVAQANLSYPTIICMPSRRRSSFSTTTDFMMMTTLDMNAAQQGR